MNKILSSILAGAAFAVLSTASAQAAVACSNTDISPTAISCSGFYSNNVLSGNSNSKATQTAGLAALGYTWDGNWSAIDLTKVSVSGKTINFAQQLFGDTIIGVHFGNGSGIGNSTAFYRFDAGSGLGLDTFTVAFQAGSSAVLYKTGSPPPLSAVPEPATWAMMITGFGLAGSALRRRRGAAALA